MTHEPAKLDDLKPPDGFSRREWLLNLGSAVVLSGFSGFPAEATKVDASASATLPPGLYSPSIDHVTHALNSDGPFLPIPPGAETEFVRPRSGPYVSQAFSPEEFTVVRRIVEIILGQDLQSAAAQPASGSPENIHAEVAEWIDLVVLTGPSVRNAARTLTPEERALAVAYFTSEDPVRELENYEPEKVCKEGLAWLQQEAQHRFAKSFQDLPAAGQLELVHSISDARPDLSVTNAGTRCMDFLKAEAVRGFYTSRIGLKELNYQGNAFYGESPGCPNS